MFEVYKLIIEPGICKDGPIVFLNRNVSWQKIFFFFCDNEGISNIFEILTYRKFYFSVWIFSEITLLPFLTSIFYFLHYISLI